jgi:amino acid permease
VPDFFYSKTCVVLVFCFCVALPLSLFPHIHDLSFSSFLAVASVFVVAGTAHIAHARPHTHARTHALTTRHDTRDLGMVIARGIESCVDGRMVDGQRQEDAVVVFNLQFDFFLAVPLVVFSLGCHLQVVPVYHSLKVRDAPHHRTRHTTHTTRTRHTRHTRHTSG